MKRIVFVILFVLITGTISARKKQFVDTYSRNSLSLIVVEGHGGVFESTMKDAASSYKNEKFDFNEIDIKTIKKLKPQKPSDRYPSSPVDIEKQLNDLEVGKKILSYWFNRTNDGRMSEDRVLERGRLNATDQDVRNAMATKIGKEMIAESGYDLIKRSYVIVLDANETMNNGKIAVVSLSANVYSVDITEETLDRIFLEGWIYDDDDISTLTRKAQFYDNLEIPIKKCCTIEKKISYLPDTKHEVIKFDIQTAIDKILSDKKMSEWKVVSPILRAHPIQSKIGKKEGVTNGQKFVVYENVEKKDGNLQSQKIGQVRAANKIIDNRGESSGNTRPTTFYQISGSPVRPGMMLIEKKDLKTNVRAGIQVSDMGDMSPELGISRLLWLNTFGWSRFAVSHYASLDFFTEDLEFESESSFITAGYGCGIRFLKGLELMPFFRCGTDLDGEEFYFESGLGLNIQIAYPVDVSLRISKNNDLIPLFSFGVRLNL